MKNIKYCNKEGFMVQGLVLVLADIKAVPVIGKILADKLADEYSTSLHKNKNTGFIIRAKKDIDEKVFKKALVKSVEEYCSENLDEVSDMLEARYEFEYNDQCVEYEYLIEKFDIEFSKKYIHVDLDV